MHYYKRHIGDYAKKTGRLTMLEHGAYTLLIDACYDRERFPTRDEAIEWAWARTTQEIEAVEFVLSRFFELVDGLYVQKRIQEEVDGYHGNSATNKRIAIEREENRRQRARTVHESSPDVHEPPPNHKPLTTNQEPVTKGKRSQPLTTPSGVSPQVWTDWLALRKAKRAPVTQTVVDGAIREAEKAGMTLEAFLQIWCRRGSQGLEASWLKPDERQQATETTYQRSMRLRMQEAVPEIAKREPTPNEFFDSIDVQTLEVKNEPTYRLG